MYTAPRLFPLPSGRTDAVFFCLGVSLSHRLLNCGTMRTITNRGGSSMTITIASAQLTAAIDTMGEHAI